MILEIRYQSSTKFFEIEATKRIFNADEQANFLGNTNERFDDGYDGRLKPN